MKKFDCVVVGSGPAAMGATAGLLARGIVPTVVDVGHRIDIQRSNIADRLRDIPRNLWTQLDLNAIMSGGRQDDIKKTVFGSAFAYGSTTSSTVIRDRGFGGNFSQAFGGLSNVWGSAVLPFRSGDMTEWPISSEDLEHHYEEILRLVPLAGARDGLERFFPLHTDNVNVIKDSALLEALGTDATRNSEKLERAGVFFGKSRLAFWGESNGRPGCTACGLCMHGCPYDVIYRTGQTFDAWITAGKINYIGGQEVRRFTEGLDGAILQLRNVKSGEIEDVRCRRLFLAAGVLPTATILLRSTNCHSLRGLDSQLFTFPFLRTGPVPRSDDTPGQTLSHLFAEICLSDDTMAHFQFYPYSDIVERSLPWGVRNLLEARPVHHLLRRRLSIVQAFLHSKLSSRFELRLEQGNGFDRLRVIPQINPATTPSVRNTVRRLASFGKELRGIVVHALTQVAEVGSSFHVGGTVPMRTDPQAGECSPHGLLSGTKAVYVCDSSTFPSIPGTTITLSIMANARRIATAAG